MNILIAGGSGFIGSNLTKHFIKEKHVVKVLDIKPPLQNGVDFYKWDLEKAFPPPEVLSGFEVIINLVGVNIFKRWNQETKQAIYSSRIKSVANLVNALKKSDTKPKVFVCASAVGYYGDSGNKPLTEESPAGNSFLSNLCVDWEREAENAEELGIRVIQIRTSPVLGKGGFLSILLPFYKLGLGGVVGSGRQWFPWIHMNDLVRIYDFCVQNPTLKGPVNAVSPTPIRYKDFSDALAKQLNRPAFWRIPKLTLSLMYGEFADEITSGQRVVPQKLIESGFQFKFSKIDKALEEVLLNS